MNAIFCNFNGMWKRFPKYMIAHLIDKKKYFYQGLYTSIKLHSLHIITFFHNLLKCKLLLYDLLLYSTFSTVVIVCNYRYYFSCISEIVPGSAWLKCCAHHWLVTFQFRSHVSSFWRIAWAFYTRCNYSTKEFKLVDIHIPDSSKFLCPRFWN